MSADRSPSTVRHLAGLALAAITTGALILLWTDGLPFLRGTMFQDLRYVAYGVGVLVILVAADRLSSLLIDRL